MTDNVIIDKAISERRSLATAFYERFPREIRDVMYFYFVAPTVDRGPSVQNAGCQIAILHSNLDSDVQDNMNQRQLTRSPGETDNSLSNYFELNAKEWEVWFSVSARSKLKPELTWHTGEEQVHKLGAVRKLRFHKEQGWNGC
jgi:hypothetical protein